MSSSVYTTTFYNRLETVDDGVNVTVHGYDPEGNLVLKFIDDGDGVTESPEKEYYMVHLGFACAKGHTGECA